MENEKELGIEDTVGVGPEAPSEASSSRARNRTVMLTPEMTSQVRSRFAQEMDSPPPYQPANAARHAGGEQASGGGGFYTPSTRSQGESTGHTSNSGALLNRNQPQAAAPVGDGIVWVKESPIVGFLVTYESNPNGTVYVLRSGRLIITNSSMPNENTLIISDASVSSMHAILRISQSGEIQVLDQLSEFGTKIKRFGSDDEEVLSGDKSSVEHGDTISFGSVSFFVCLVPKGNQG